MEPSGKPRVGISACLLGERVRYDGRDKRHALLLEALGPYVEWVPVCPELEAGMGVPREPIRLVGRPGAPRLLGERSGADHTAAMRRLAELRVAQLAALGLSGWVTKRGSPSCGLRGVPVHAAGGGRARRAGVGAFVRVLRARLPRLAVADELQLEDAAFRGRFLARLQRAAARIARCPPPSPRASAPRCAPSARRSSRRSPRSPSGRGR